MNIKIQSHARVNNPGDKRPESQTPGDPQATNKGNTLPRTTNRTRVTRGQSTHTRWRTSETRHGQRSTGSKEETKTETQRTPKTHRQQMRRSDCKSERWQTKSHSRDSTSANITNAHNKRETNTDGTGKTGRSPRGSHRPAQTHIQQTTPDNERKHQDQRRTTPQGRNRQHTDELSRVTPQPDRPTAQKATPRTTSDEPTEREDGRIHVETNQNDSTSAPHATAGNRRQHTRPKKPNGADRRTEDYQTKPSETNRRGYGDARRAAADTHTTR